MEKGTGAIAIIAFLIAAAGFGYLFYDSMQPAPVSPIETMYIIEKLAPQLQPGVVRTWSDFTSNSRNLNDLMVTLQRDPDIAINFTVNSGESVYFSFVCAGILKGTSVVINGYLSVSFCIDGNTVNYPTSYMSANVSSGLVNGVLAIQNVTSYLAPGSHNVTLIYGYNNVDASVSYVLSRSLVVQTLIP